jgi:hypothetical protein
MSLIHPASERFESRQVLKVRSGHPYVQSVQASLRLIERRGRVLGFIVFKRVYHLKPIHRTEQRCRHPAGPRYDRVEHRGHNICRSLCTEISPRGLKLLFVLTTVPRLL